MGAKKLNEQERKEIRCTRRAPWESIKSYSMIALKILQALLAFFQITLSEFVTVGFAFLMLRQNSQVIEFINLHDVYKSHKNYIHDITNKILPTLIKQIINRESINLSTENNHKCVTWCPKLADFTSVLS